MSRDQPGVYHFKARLADNVRLCKNKTKQNKKKTNEQHSPSNPNKTNKQTNKQTKTPEGITIKDNLLVANNY